MSGSIAIGWKNLAIWPVAIKPPKYLPEPLWAGRGVYWVSVVGQPLCFFFIDPLQDGEPHHCLKDELGPTFEEEKRIKKMNEKYPQG